MLYFLFLFINTSIAIFMMYVNEVLPYCTNLSLVQRFIATSQTAGHDVRFGSS